MFSLLLREKVQGDDHLDLEPRIIYSFLAIHWRSNLGVCIRCYHRYFFPNLSSTLTNLSTGPYGADIFDPRSWGHSSNSDEPINTIIIEFTRIVLTIGMFAIGIELPKAYVVKHWKSMFFLLVPVTTWVRILAIYHIT